jgi:hypothetical protein
MQLKFVLFRRLTTKIEAIRCPLEVKNFYLKKKKKKKRDYKMMELENGGRERGLLMMIDCFLMMNRTQQVESVSIG